MQFPHAFFNTIFFFSFYLGFLSRTFTIHKTAGKGGGYHFNSSLPLQSTSQIFRNQPGDYCRELTSGHSLQPDSNREPLVSERKSLTTNLHALKALTIRLRAHLLKRKTISEREKVMNTVKHLRCVAPLVPFVQFKKRFKACNFIKNNTPSLVSFTFLTCTNGTKSRKA